MNNSIEDFKKIREQRKIDNEQYRTYSPEEKVA